MKRKTFAEVLRSGQIDLTREYLNLHWLFYSDRLGDEEYGRYSIWDLAEMYFPHLEFPGMSVSLTDFDSRYGFDFPETPLQAGINEVVCLAEYVCNLLTRLQSAVSKHGFSDYSIGVVGSQRYYVEQIQLVSRHVERLVETIGYQAVQDGEFIILVERDALANRVSTFLPDSISYRVLSYRHHSYEGDLSAKSSILTALGHELEPRRKELKQISPEREQDIFYGLNNLDIRHNNPEVRQSVTDEELERLYDELYLLMLIAFAELDAIDGGNLLRAQRRAEVR